MPHPQIEDIVSQSGLAPLISCCIETGDRGLLSALAERWHRETSSFHMPFGEMTITLDDVSALFHLPIIGAFQLYDTVSMNEAVYILVELLGVDEQDAIDECLQCHCAYVCLGWLQEIYHSRCEGMHWTEASRAYLLHLVGCTIFANKSSTHISVAFLQCFRDLSGLGGYAWGVVALVYMYENLNEAFMFKTKHLAGFITLLHCWIYEHLPTIGNMIDADDYDEG